MDTTILFAKENSYVNTIFGRRIHISGIKDKNPMTRGGAERQAISVPLVAEAGLGDTWDEAH